MNSKEFKVKVHQELSYNGIFSSTGKSEHIFWPGCAVLSMGSEIVDKTFQLLKSIIPDISYSTSCCGKPSKYIINGEDFDKRRIYLENSFKENGIKYIYTLCPNCFVTLGEFKNINVQTVWKLIDENFPDEYLGVFDGTELSLHDPCPIVNDVDSAYHVRNILNKMGVVVLEFPNNREKTMCCGKKNMLMTLDPDKGMKIFNQRASQAPSRNIVTYCASCRDTFKENSFNSYHILELLFNIEASSSWRNRYKAVKHMKRRYKAVKHMKRRYKDA